MLRQKEEVEGSKKPSRVAYIIGEKVFLDIKNAAFNNEIITTE